MKPVEYLHPAMFDGLIQALIVELRNTGIQSHLTKIDDNDNVLVFQKSNWKVPQIIQQTEHHDGGFAFAYEI